MKKTIRCLLAITIFVIVAVSVAIPVFAFGTSVPKGDYIYYKYWNVGGSGDSYHEVRQRNRNHSGMVPGNDVAMILTEKYNRYELASAVKLTCKSNVPSNVPSVKDFYVKEKLMKQTGIFAWTPVPFSDGSTLHKVVTGKTFPRSTSISYEYNATAVKTMANSKNNDIKGNHNYQIDLVCPYVESEYATFYRMFFQSGITMK